MTYTYDAGTTTPNVAGLVEIDGVIRISDGTFVLTFCDLFNGPPVRDSVSSLPSDDGGLWGAAFYDPFPFSITGYLTVPTLDDVWAAKDQLRGAFNLSTGIQTLLLNASGWSARRQVAAQVAGPVVFDEPTMLEKLVPDRDFTIPMMAADPRLYNADATFSVNINRGSSGTVTNAGNYPSPLTALFVGPLTNPQLDGPGTGGTNRIKLKNSDGTDFVIAGGDSVTVTTNPAAVGGVTVVDNSGTNVYSSTASFRGGMVAPGSGSWALSGDAGSGHVTVTLRDAWV